MNIINEIFSLYELKGGSAYIGEPVTQLEHALQTAIAAQRHQSRPEMIVAALLHDVGHLLDQDAEDVSTDRQHEFVGEVYLRKYFKAEVAELVKQHVNAKRYLTAINKTYLANLSSASLHSLALQGGPMSVIEVKQFAAHPLFTDILLLRYWDEGAKIANKHLPSIKQFTPYLQQCL